MRSCGLFRQCARPTEQRHPHERLERQDGQGHSAGKGKTKAKGGPAIAVAKAAEAFARIEVQLAKVETPAGGAPSVDVDAMVERVLSVVPEIYKQRAKIVAELPKHPIAALDELEGYALAAWYAQRLVEHAGQGETAASGDLVTEASHLREGLLVAAEALAHRGLLDKDAVAKIRAAGSADPAADLIALADLYTANWPTVGSKTAVERAEVARAVELGPLLSLAASAKKYVDSSHAAGSGRSIGDARDGAVVLLMRAYDSVRRALAYVRWAEGDADSIAPTLVVKAKPRKASAETPSVMGRVIGDVVDVEVKEQVVIEPDAHADV